MSKQEIITADKVKEDAVTIDHQAASETVSKLENMAQHLDAAADSEQAEFENVQSGDVTQTTDQQTIFLVNTLFGLVAMSKGQHWALSPTEAEALGMPLDEVLNKHFPNYGDYIGCEVSLAVALGVLIVPRMAMDKQISKAEKETAKDADVVNEPNQKQKTGLDAYGFAEDENAGR